MKIDITAFDGIRPRIGSHLLENGTATIARNCRVGSGMLKPLGVPVDVRDVQNRKIATVMRSSLASAESMYHWQGKWLFYSDWRSFAPGPALSYEDEQEDSKGVNERRLYMSAENGGLYVYRSGGDWKMGVPAPTTAPTVATSTSPDPDATKETRVYVYTYVNKLGQESAPSPASAAIDVQGQKVLVSGLNGDAAQIAADGYCPIQYSRIYRLETGNEGAEYLFVKQRKITNASYEDNVKGEKLGEVLMSLGWREPPDGLKMLTTAGSVGYAAFAGNELRFSQPGYPYAWPDALSHILEYEIVGMVRSSVHLYIFTKGSVYYMSLEDITSSVPVKMEGIYQCVSARGIVSVPGGAVFPCQDGLYFVGAGYSKPFKLSAFFFDEPQWAAMWPQYMRGAYSNGTLYYFLGQQAWRASCGLLMKLGLDEGGNANIRDLTTTDCLVLVPYADDDGNLYVKTQDGQNQYGFKMWEGEVNGDAFTHKENMLAVWQSKSYLTGNKVNFSCAIVEKEIQDDPVYEKTGQNGYAAVQDELPVPDETQQPEKTTVIFYRNGKEFYRKVILDREAFVLPSGFQGRTLQVRIKTKVWVRRIAVAESMAELFA